MVSVIVPVYNAEKYIRHCLDSICSQTYSDLEIVLVNDGSKDNSLSILQEYAEKDSRIHVIDQENRGVASARNTGLQNAHGEYILYVDADDWIEADMVERLLSYTPKEDIVFCGSDSANSDSDVKKVAAVETEEWDHDRQLLEFMKHKRMTGMLWNKLIRRRLTEGISFNEKTGYGEDAEFLWQVLKNSNSMLATNEILYHHILDSDSISGHAFSEKKYSAIPMWEKINEDVVKHYPHLISLAQERLMCAAVFSMYEAKQAHYQNKEHIAHMRKITRNYIFSFLRAKNISLKFKLYAIAVCLGY